MRWHPLALVIGLSVMSVCVRAGPENSDSTEAWRQAYETKLRGPDGWLSVAGLFFLVPGANTVGTDPSNHIVLPRGTAPAHAGVVRYADDRVVFEPGPGVHPTLNGAPADGP